MPEWFDVSDFLARCRFPLAVRLNVSMDRAFSRSGTSISTRLLVFDKAEDDAPAITAHVNDAAELVSLVDALPIRSGTLTRPVLPRPLTASVRILPQTRRRPVAPVRPTPRGGAKPILLEFVPLEEAAPIAEQVGHYLPYRPSRISIPGAMSHPTPLVESVAMGSIAAPVPNVQPRVSADHIERGL